MSTYAAALATGSTTLCRCFRITRRDGVALGFTDHDRDLTVDGLVYRAASALSASEAAAAVGLAPNEMDAEGALSSDAITERDLHAGRYDGAEVVVLSVDWTDPAIRKTLGVYTLGEIERAEVAFRAELRSRTAGLDRKVGEVVSPMCGAEFGDARCGLDLSAPGLSASVAVVAIDGPDVTVSGLGGFDLRVFRGGRIAWTSGENAGTSSDIRAGQSSTAGARLGLWRPPAFTVAPGDTGIAYRGCDKSLGTCRALGNLVNFRGFPHVPGETFAAEYVIPGDPSQTGGSRFD